LERFFYIYGLNYPLHSRGLEVYAFPASLGKASEYKNVRH